VFFLQDVGEINGIQVPFTIGIQTPIQYESMLSYGHNGAIFMDATFGTNDMKFHLFTLMGFDDHCIIVVTYEIRVFFEGAQKEVFSNF